MASKGFEFYVKADLKEYEGKYVAIVGEKVAASGDNAKEVLEEAKKKFPNKTPMLAKVPKDLSVTPWVTEIKGVGERLLGRTDVFNLSDICFKKNQKTVFN